jgi:hypothetical protein
MILKFEKFILEKLGIIEELDSIADLIYNNLKDKNYFKLEINYLNQDIIIECFRIYSLYNSGDFSVLMDNTFKLRIKDLSKPTIIHELKHLDRYLRKKDIADDYDYLKKLDKYILNYEFLFKGKKYARQLITILYYSNQEEFESHFNHIYIELKEELELIENKDDRKELIKEYLNEERLYIIYHNFYYNKFDIRKFFKSDNDLFLFIEKFYNELSDNNIELSIISVIKTKIKSLINYKTNKDINNHKKVINDINNLVNNNIKRNYKKIYRLFTLLL